jgi:hypothetical protein
MHFIAIENSEIHSVLSFEIGLHVIEIVIWPALVAWLLNHIPKVTVSTSEL